MKSRAARNSTRRPCFASRDPEQFLYQHEHLIMGLSYALAKSARLHRDIVDRDLIVALTAIGKAYETLVNSGLHYESQITSVTQQAVIQELQTMVKEYREAEQKHTGNDSPAGCRCPASAGVPVAHGAVTHFGPAQVAGLYRFPVCAISGEGFRARNTRRGSEPPYRAVIFFTACPAGRASRNSRIVRLSTGCRRSGAISFNGSSTKRRRCISG